MARGGRDGRQGGNRGSRNKEPLSREVMVSKKLSWLLRHGAEKEGLELGRGGYANLQHVLQNRNIRSLQPVPTLREVSELVKADDKQRFSLIHVGAAPQDSSAPKEASADLDTTSPTPQDTQSMLASDTDPANYLIRANQGHSVNLGSGAEDLLVPITAEADNLPRLVVHGTRRDHWQRIVASGGLKPMTRNHVHFATGLPAAFNSKFGATKKPNHGVNSKDGVREDVVELPDKKNAPLVLSGMRETSTILMFLDLPRAIENGLRFYLSANGVVLSEGNEQGIIPLPLFECVEDRDGTTLVQEGKLLNSRSQAAEDKS